MAVLQTIGPWPLEGRGVCGVGQVRHRVCVCVQILPLVQSAVACRLELHSALPGNKDLLYLDLALEGVVRSAMERGIGSLGMGACAFVGPLLQNLVRPHPRLRCRVNAQLNLLG